ncbi:MAG: nucleotidyltransferase domain-containing protein [Rectinemataceae bacterium]|nr:nucleotidyltransferase domain-containing protein [Rectinemataceae bacterium]
MRLSNRLKGFILHASRQSFGDAEVYLFGSRMKETQKGGDIDLAIKTDMGKNEFRAGKIKFKACLVRLDLDIGMDVVRFAPDMDYVLRSEILSSSFKLSE